MRQRYSMSDRGCPPWLQLFKPSTDPFSPLSFESIFIMPHCVWSAGSVAFCFCGRCASCLWLCPSIPSNPVVRCSSVHFRFWVRLGAPAVTQAPSAASHCDWPNRDWPIAALHTVAVSVWTDWTQVDDWVTIESLYVRGGFRLFAYSAQPIHLPSLVITNDSF